MYVQRPKAGQAMSPILGHNYREADTSITEVTNSLTDKGRTVHSPWLKHEKSFCPWYPHLKTHQIHTWMWKIQYFVFRSCLCSPGTKKTLRYNGCTTVSPSIWVAVLDHWVGCPRHSGGRGSLFLKPNHFLCVHVHCRRYMYIYTANTCALPGSWTTYRRWH